MVEIRELNEQELKDAIHIKAKCWTEELAGRAENTIDEQAEVRDAWDWQTSEVENMDIRLLLGAFEDGVLLGVAFASFAEIYDAPDGFELNGLWVDEKYRNKGVSLKLLSVLFNYFKQQGKTVMVVYSHHDAPSNSYYRKFGAQVFRQERQMNGKLLIDVFIGDIATMQERVSYSLVHHH